MTDNRPLLLDFDADWRTAHPGVEWYSIATCAHDAAILENRRERRTTHSAEYVAARLAVGDTEGADIAATLQHAEGFRANCAGVEFQEFRPAAWLDGWLDAHDLGAFAPIEYFRLQAEV